MIIKPASRTPLSALALCVLAEREAFAAQYVRSETGLGAVSATSH
jgi:acyl-CoA reductase-like NAD-dependent aldehyde dehydrogenase